jgi:hypothetical protein
MKYFLWILVLTLVILHQDYWQWNETGLVFGVLPRTLAYHMGLSVAAAFVWALAVRFCWPAEQEPQ